MDVRGYGSSYAPKAIDEYRLVCLAGDCVGVVQTLGEDSSLIVGHDWGSPIASAAASFRPDIFKGIALLSVPYTPRNDGKPSDFFRSLGGEEEFYIEYFQELGRAEAEISQNPSKWLEGFYFTASGNAPAVMGDEGSMGFVSPGGELKDRFKFPEEPLPWFTPDDLDFYTKQFEKSGFTGPLNRYRCVDLDWNDLRMHHEAPLMQPSLFIGGEKDGPTIWGAGSISRFPDTLPNLKDSVILPNVGHWIQQEDPDSTNSLLLDFFQTFNLGQ
jgi:pimeloyl-ACP methyl ester carboxylesterase